MGIATIAVAMNRHNAAASRIVAITKDASRIAVNSGVAGTTMSGAKNEAQVQTMNSTGASAFRSNTATGIMWSMTGAATI